MVTRVVPVGKKKVLIPANIRNCKSLRGFSMIDYFNCATDFADKFFFPDPKWLKTITSSLRTLRSSRRNLR